jgi:hypothetical protein
MVICDYDQQEGTDYWHCNEQSVAKTKCCGFAYCIDHAWFAEEHETAGVPLFECDGISG